MTSSVNNFIRLVLLLALLLIGMGIWKYVNGIRTQFPDLDFRRSQIGIASWYSETDKHINEYTASGEKFDDQAIACASWYFPYGEKLLVINTFNGDYVVCRVNDRGPAKRLRRKIDLTKAAFEKIAHTKKGLITVAIIPTEKKPLPRGPLPD